MPRSGGDTRPRNLYFVNGAVDCALIGGISIAAFAVLGWCHSPAVTAQLAWTGLLARICNWPHFAATSYRLYHTRDNVRQFPVTALVIPLFVFGFMVWAMSSPDRVAPAYAKLVQIWSPYHFSAQSLGITLIYARRAGFTVGKMERLSLAGFIFAGFAANTARAEAGEGVRSWFAIEHPKLGLPLWVGDGFDLVMWSCAAVFVLLVVRWCMVERRALPPIVLLPAVTHFVWFVLGRGIDDFQSVVPFFHSLQYMFIAWTVHLKERIDAGQATPSKHYLVFETTRWWLMSFIGGLLLFLLFPYVYARLGYSPLLAASLAVTAVQMHHFFVDGVIWKLKTAGASSPLLVNVEQLIRPAPRPIAEAA
jgi:hypothetical protein